MPTIYLPESTTQAQRLAALKVIRDAVLTNPNWSGAEISVKRGDHACVYAEGRDSYKLTALVRQVQAVFEPSEA